MKTNKVANYVKKAPDELVKEAKVVQGNSNSSFFSGHVLAKTISWLYTIYDHVIYFIHNGLAISFPRTAIKTGRPLRLTQGPLTTAGWMRKGQLFKGSASDEYTK